MTFPSDEDLLSRRLHAVLTTVRSDPGSVE